MGFSAVAAAATVLSTATTVEAQQQASSEKAAEESYNAQVAADNEDVAQQQAQDVLSQGQADAQQQRLKAAALVGALRANTAADGVTLDSGSALDTQSDAAEQGELNAESTLNASQRQAYGLQARAMDQAAQSGLDDSEVGFTNQASGLSLLGDASNAASSATNPNGWASMF